MIGKKLAHYEVLELIGRGGMGEVYRARDTKLGREVALKFLPDEFAADSDRLRRFRNEAKALATLNHPRVASIYGIEELEDTSFLVMELVEGRDLQQHIEQGALDPSEAVRIAAQICEGLEAAHAKGLVHRDLKPANIKLGDDGAVKILDFGLAKTIRYDSEPNDATMLRESGDGLTQAGSAVGTAQYMAPEQALGKAVDARSDLFALGALIYEMLTGRKAFDGNTPAGVYDAILHGHPEPADRVQPGLSRDLVCVVESALQKDPQRRPVSAHELREKLLAVDLESGGSTRAPSIAVLSFVNMSADPENEYFTDGLAEEILNSLARVENLRVASRTSSFAFKGKQVDAREIARILEVESLLEGSVRRSGPRLRISVQLVKADDGYQLWSERYDREMKDVFEVQDEIAQSITAALRVVLSPEEQKSLQQTPTNNVEAYDAYLQGRGRHQKFGKDNVHASFNLFVRATELDPDFTLAWVEVVTSALWLHQWYNITDEQLRASERAVERVNALAPNTARARLVEGMVALMHEDRELAESSLRQATRLDPGLYEAQYYLARLLLTLGRMAESVPFFRGAAQAWPEDYQAACIMVGVLDGIGESEEARRAAAEAIARVERAIELYPADTRALSLGSSVLMQIGDEEHALEWTRRSLELAPTDSGVRYNAACAFARAGRIDDAFEVLERNIRAGWGNREWIEADHDMDPLRGDPRFQQLLDLIPEAKAKDR